MGQKNRLRQDLFHMINTVELDNNSHLRTGQNGRYIQMPAIHRLSLLSESYRDSERSQWVEIPTRNRIR